MPDLKISQLPVATTPLAGTELVPIVQGGVTDRTTVAAFLSAGLPVSATTLSASGAVTLSGGTANGVLYLDGSKVATSGSALTFDGNTARNNQSSGTNSYFRTTSGTVDAYFGVATAGLSIGVVVGSFSNNDVVFYQNSTEGMRLTSAGLGIGTSSTTNGRLSVQAGTGTTGNSAFFQTLDGLWNTYLQIQHSTAGIKLFNGNSNSAVGNNLIFGNASTAETMRIDSSGNLIQTAPTTPPTLSTNGTMVFNLTSNTNLRVSVRGSDGVTRVADLTLA